MTPTISIDPLSADPALADAAATPSILAINGGSTSLRFALVAAADPRRRLLTGKIDRIGQPGATWTIDEAIGGRQGPVALAAADLRGAVAFLVEWLAAHPAAASLRAIGHRVVQGMTQSPPVRVTPALIAGLRGLTAEDPEHLPLEIALIEAFAARHPGVPQIVCYDSAFHRTMPRVARLMAIPRRYAANGVERYGFHGISYEFLMAELARLGDPAAAKGRVILAHLGGGASLAAVRDGECIDTTMGFTPGSGLVMGTRSGDIDPGLSSYLARTEAMSASRFQALVTHESGLLGISETSADMRDLLAAEAEDERAAEAVALFTYQIRKWIGAFAAALGGLDTLVFAGGIGEGAPAIRARVCAGLGFLGVELDPGRNQGQEPRISADWAPVTVRVIHSDEELMIAKSVIQALDETTEQSI